MAISESGETSHTKKPLSLSGALCVSRFLNLEVNEDLTIHEDNSPKISLTSFVSKNLAGLSGKMSPVFLRLTTEHHSGTSSPDLQNAGMAWRGECLMLNTSESPSVAVESSLSDVLEVPSVPEEYYLTAEDCRYILEQRFVRKRTIKNPMLSILKRDACQEH